MSRSQFFFLAIPLALVVFLSQDGFPKSIGDASIPGRALVAQVAPTPDDEIVLAKKRADDLLSFLKELEKELADLQNLQPSPLTLSVLTSGTGSGNVSGGDISCGTACSTKVTSGTFVMLTATPATNSVFAGWSGGYCSGTGSTCLLEVKSDITVTAEFAIVVSISPTNGQCGAINNSCVSGTLVDSSDSATQYLWGCNGLSGGTDASCSSDKPLSPLTLSVLTSGTGSGNVSGGDISCGTACSTKVTSGTFVMLTATPATNSVFAGWSGGYCSGTGSTCLLEVKSDITVTAEFAPAVTPIVSGEVDIKGTGADAATDVIFFGLLNLFESSEKTLQVINKSGSTITFADLYGLSEPFSFKGGSYPGAGGTCQENILPNSTCTVTLTFTPMGASGVDVDSVKLTRHRRAPVKFTYKRAGSTGESNLLTFSGQSYFSAELAVDVTGTEGAVDARIGEKRAIRINIRTLEVARPFVVLPVVLPPGPLSIGANTCYSDEPLIQCYVEIVFSPITGGTFPLSFELSINDGKAAQKFPITKELNAIGFRPIAPGTPEENLLVVYNKDWPASITAKDYYINNRPGFSDVNTLGISLPISPACSTLRCLSDVLERVPYSNIINDVVNPIIDWIKTHPQKDIRFIVLMHGIPNRPKDVSYEGPYDGSLQYILRTAIAKDPLLSKEVFITSLDMGSFEATKAYITKLKNLGRGSLVISGPIRSLDSAYYFEDSGTRANLDTAERSGLKIRNAVKSINPSATVHYRGPSEEHFNLITDVLGYMTWGKNSDWDGRYMLNGNITFTGTSGWYILQTFESHNGQWVHSEEGLSDSDHYQGNFIKFFSRNAFGASNYEYTPVAMVSTVDEPKLMGINDASLFSCYDKGFLFSYCAWQSNHKIWTQMIGDPLVTK